MANDPYCDSRFRHCARRRVSPSVSEAGRQEPLSPRHQQGNPISLGGENWIPEGCELQVVNPKLSECFDRDCWKQGARSTATKVTTPNLSEVIDLQQQAVNYKKPAGQTLEKWSGEQRIELSISAILTFGR